MYIVVLLFSTICQSFRRTLNVVLHIAETPAYMHNVNETLYMYMYFTDTLHVYYILYVLPSHQIQLNRQGFGSLPNYSRVEIRKHQIWWSWKVLYRMGCN